MQMKINKHAVSKEAELETAIRDAYPKVYSYLYHRTLDAALSKDLTQETFYRFYRHLDQYEEQGKLLNFLYRIARHLVYDHTRSRRYTDELQEEQMRDDTYNGERLFQKKEEFVILRSWISERPPHLQDVLLLRYDEGLKYRDISQVTGIHVSTVKSQVRLELHILKNVLRRRDGSEKRKDSPGNAGNTGHTRGRYCGGYHKRKGTATKACCEKI